MDLKARPPPICARRAGSGRLQTIRKEGARFPLPRWNEWDNGRDVVLAGDAAGWVVAPSSGEGIFYAMIGGAAWLAIAAATKLQTGMIKDSETGSEAVHCV